MDFIALDVETANPDLSSVCQIGIAKFADGRLVEKWESLVNPEDYFDPINSSIHGIDETMVAGAPKFSDLCDDFCNRLSDSIVVHHTHFDRAAVGSLFSRYGRQPPQCTWLDSACVVRRAWTELSRSGYGLRNVADRFGIQFRHHNAAEDARAAGEIFLRAIQETGLSAADWVIRVRQPIFDLAGSNSSKIRITRDGNPDGALYGEVALFTGTLSIPRRDAADLAATAGCQVVDSFNKSVTLLIVGNQDVRRLAGHEKSTKHRKAEVQITKGAMIRILCESDFCAIVE